MRGAWILGVLLLLGCAGAERRTQEACVDRWLADRGLDPYGNPRGTVYAGGTPLFDERTGTATDRLTYLFARHPEAQLVCGWRLPSPAA